MMASLLSLSRERTDEKEPKTLGAKKAAELDKELMSEEGGFSIDQLMELAGLSVSQAIFKVHPPSAGKRILVACGPGNNGGDGLVAARHLHHYGYTPTVFYPKPTNQPIFTGLQKQLRSLHIAFTADFSSALEDADLIVDSLFGFSFKPPVREPFVSVIELLSSSATTTATKTTTAVPVFSVDIPSCWHVEDGPPAEGQLGSNFMPRYLISLTAPKPCVRFFRGRGRRHFVGGRFLSADTARRFVIDVPPYQGCDQVVEVAVAGDWEAAEEKL